MRRRRQLKNQALLRPLKRAPASTARSCSPTKKTQPLGTLHPLHWQRTRGPPADPLIYPGRLANRGGPPHHVATRRHNTRLVPVIRRPPAHGARRVGYYGRRRRTAVPSFYAGLSLPFVCYLHSLSARARFQERPVGHGRQRTQKEPPGNETMARPPNEIKLGMRGFGKASLARSSLFFRCPQFFMYSFFCACQRHRPAKVSL